MTTPSYLPSQEQIEAAIVASKGALAIAAKALGIHRNTLYNWLAGRGRDDLDTDRIKDIINHEREMLIDRVELKAYDVALNDSDPGMLRFLLETAGKDRGYARRTEVTGAEGSPVKVEHIGADAINEIARSIYGTPED